MNYVNYSVNSIFSFSPLFYQVLTKVQNMFKYRGFFLDFACYSKGSETIFTLTKAVLNQYI